MSEPSREPDATVAFVLECLFTGAVDLDEVRRWADRAIELEPHPPVWLIDLSLFDGPLKDIYRLIRLVPDREFTDDEEAAIAGIAYERNRSVGDVPHGRKRALAALRAHPGIRGEFVRTFPFLTFS